jgi:predicted phosphodiesterase
MRFTLISDVHVDNHAWDWSVLQHCDPQIPMVVVGDISNDVFETSRWIRDLRERFFKVIWVAGNHCFYNLGFHKTRLHDPEFDRKWPYPKTVEEIYDHYARWSLAHDVHFLHRNSVISQGLEFVGATGWHNFDAVPGISFDDQVSAWQSSLNDSRCINWGTGVKGDYKPVLQAALDDADYIRSAVRANTNTKVVITHHVPHHKFIKHTTNHMWNLLNGSFLNTELESCVDDSVKVWCFGHTHFRADQDVQGIRYVNNARGYARENPNWFPVEIEVDA